MLEPSPWNAGSTSQPTSIGQPASERSCGLGPPHGSILDGRTRRARWCRRSLCFRLPASAAIRDDAARGRQRIAKNGSTIDRVYHLDSSWMSTTERYIANRSASRITRVSPDCIGEVTRLARAAVAKSPDRTTLAVRRLAQSLRVWR